jgi:regulator of sigma E protease
MNPSPAPAEPASPANSPWWQTVAFVAALALLLHKAPTWAAAVAFLGLVITVHELGHFIVARWTGMRVEIFSLGFGPPLLQFRHGDTVYQIAAVPLGGFVKPAGEDPKSDEDIARAKPDEFMGRPWWARALVLLAGPAMNLLFPVLALFLLYVTLGRSYPWGPPRVEAVSQDSGAYAGGIRPGDLIVRINGQQVHNIKLLPDLVDRLSRVDRTQPLTVEVLRERKPLTLKVKTRLNEKLGKYLMGVSVQPSPPPYSNIVATVGVLSPAEKAGFKAGDVVESVDGRPVLDGFKFSELFAEAERDPVPVVVRRPGQGTLTLWAAKRQPVPEFFDPRLVGLVGLDFVPADSDQAQRREKLSVGGSLKAAVFDTAAATAGIVLSFAEFIKGRLSVRESLGGPVAILRMAAQQADKGWEDLLQLMLQISLTLGIMNLLPIPLLDGGTFVFCLVEGLRGRPLKLKTQVFFQNMGLAVIGSLFIFITVNDLLRLAGI